VCGNVVDWVGSIDFGCGSVDFGCGSVDFGCGSVDFGCGSVLKIGIFEHLGSSCFLETNLITTLSIVWVKNYCVWLKQSLGWDDIAIRNPMSKSDVQIRCPNPMSKSNVQIRCPNWSSFSTGWCYTHSILLVTLMGTIRFVLNPSSRFKPVGYRIPSLDLEKHNHSYLYALAVVFFESACVCKDTMRVW